MTESYDVAQQPTRKMGIGVPLLMTAGGAGLGIIANRAATKPMNHDDIIKEMAPDKIELHLKGKNAATWSEAKKWADAVKDAEAKLAEAKKPTLAPDATERTILEDAKKAFQAEKDRLQAIENSKAGGTVGDHFPTAQELKDIINDDRVGLNSKEKSKWNEAVKNLEKKEKEFASTVSKENTRKNILIQMSKDGKTVEGGSIKQLYEQINVSKTDERALDQLFERIREPEYWNNSSGTYKKQPQYAAIEKEVREYYKDVAPFPKTGTEADLPFDKVKDFGSYTESSTRPDKVNGVIVRSKRNGKKTVWISYTKEDATKYITDEQKTFDDLVESTSKDMYGNLEDATRLRYRMQDNVLYREMSKIDTSCLDWDVARKSGLLNKKGNYLDVAKLMREKGSLKTCEDSIKTITEPLNELKTILETNQRKGVPFNNVTTHVPELGNIPISANPVLPTTITDYDKALKFVDDGLNAKINKATLSSWGVTIDGIEGKTMAEAEEIIKARQTLIKQGEGEKARLQRDFDRIIKDSPLNKDIKSRIQQKESECEGLSKLRKLFRETFGDKEILSKNKKKSSTFNTLYAEGESVSGSGKIIADSDVGKSFHEAVEKAQKAFNEAAAKGGKVDETAVKAAQDVLDSNKKSLNSTIERLGNEATTMKLFRGNKWIAPAIGGVLLGAAGLTMMISKNKQQG